MMRKGVWIGYDTMVELRFPSMMILLNMNTILDDIGNKNTILRNSGQVLRNYTSYVQRRILEKVIAE